MDALSRPGLEGVVASATTICEIEPLNGKLAYRGYDIDVLAGQATFAEVAYLLLYEKLPDAEELKRFSDELTVHKALPGRLIEVLKRLPPGAHPMDVLQMASAYLGTMDQNAEDRSCEAALRKAIRTIAVLPTVVATSYRLSRLQEPISPLSRLGHVENFLYMLSGYGPDEDAVRALDAVLVLCAEHGSDASGFTARAVASSCTDYHSAITAAIGSFKGRLHGGAMEEAARMVEALPASGSVEEQVRRELAGKERITGFGHPIYRNGDPRARIAKQLSSNLAKKIGETGWHNRCEQIEQCIFAQTGLHPNVHFYAGSVLRMLGVPTGLFTPLFAVGRVAGWSTHIIEQLRENRMIRPQVNIKGGKTYHLSLLSQGTAENACSTV